MSCALSANEAEFTSEMMDPIVADVTSIIPASQHSRRFWFASIAASRSLILSESGLHLLRDGLARSTA
jgi:hypothetical protein